MIRDYFVLISVTFGLILTTILASFSYYVMLETIIEAFNPTDPTDPVYNLTHDVNDLGVGDVTDEDLEPFRMIFDIIQLCGILSVLMSMIASSLIVAKVRFHPLGIPIAVILFFIGIFISMVYSNAYVYFVDVLQSMVVEFTVHSYINWIGLNLPYITAFMGMVLFVLAYSNATKSFGRETVPFEMR